MDGVISGDHVDCALCAQDVFGREAIGIFGTAWEHRVICMSCVRKLVALELRTAEGSTAIVNALNEVLNGPDAIDDSEFSSRIGVTRHEALYLLERLRAV